MPSTCPRPGAISLPTTQELLTKPVSEYDPLEAFVSRFEPNSIDSKRHAQFRPMLHDALEHYVEARRKAWAEAVNNKTREEHEAGLDS